jgi:hypothetical protein
LIFLGMSSSFLTQKGAASNLGRFMLAKRAEDYRLEYNQTRPHQAIAWNRPKEVHLGLADPTIPTFQATETLPTT